jgi:hypothetical protein
MKKHILLLIGISIVFSPSGMGQIDALEEDLRTQSEDSVLGWKAGGNVALTFSQVSFTNWASGGDNSISAIGNLNLFLNHVGENSQWSNTFELGYGLQRLNKENTKTDDKLNFTSKYGRNVSKNWYFAGLLDFKTQVAPGYSSDDAKTRISNWMAPGYLIISLGMDYSPNEKLSIFMAPLTNKSTFVLDQALADSGSFGVPAGQKSRAEFGGYIKFLYKNEIFKNVELQTKLDLFSNYFNKPQNIDVDWEVVFNMKVNDFLTAKLTTNLIYDDDIIIGQDTNDDGIIDTSGPRVQFKQLLGIGIAVDF